ncbi:MAG TPA: cell division protein SepF [Firmicutes bacterium]|nr:cell division protein SepF [Bacillota bacterium]
MASFLDKVLAFLGVRDLEGEEVEKPDQEVKVQQKQETRLVRKGNLISLEGGAKPVRIIIIDPTHFEEVRDYVDHLKNRHPLIVRLTHLDLDEARRIVDFMSGATYAIDGNMRKLGDMIFFFAPQSVTIEGEIETTLFDLDDIGE